MNEKIFHQRFVAKKLLKNTDDYFQWLGEDIQTHKMVLIKEFNRQTPNQMAAKEFSRECTLIHKISQIQSPNIAKIYVIDLKIGYYVMEYVPGQNIHDYLVGNKISDVVAVNIVIKLAHALDILYSKFQILHRDIQPCNIQLESGTLEPKIVDLGIVKSLNSAQLTMMNQVKGTFFYLAPELIYQDADYSIQSDMYGLGLTLFYLLQRSDLFEEPEHVLQFVQEGTLPAKFKNIQNRNLAKVIFQMIDRDPKKRFGSYAELIQALTAIANTLPNAAPRPASMVAPAPMAAPAPGPMAAPAPMATPAPAPAFAPRPAPAPAPAFAPRPAPAPAPAPAPTFAPAPGMSRDQNFVATNKAEIAKLKQVLQEFIRLVKDTKDATIQLENNNRNIQGLSPQMGSVVQQNVQGLEEMKKEVNNIIKSVRDFKEKIVALEAINNIL